MDGASKQGLIIPLILHLLELIECVIITRQLHRGFSPQSKLLMLYQGGTPGRKPASNFGVQQEICMGRSVLT